jgi:hypothetical protein
MSTRAARLAALRVLLEKERATPDRNACHAREIEDAIEALLADAATTTTTDAKE